MKSGPVLSMIALLGVGVWLVLQPTLARDRYDLAVRIGSVELHTERTAEDRYRFTNPPRLAELGEISAERYQRVLDEELAAWNERPAIERHLLGFFNITGWWNLAWVVVGLGGQAAFFGRMLIQWVVSEKRRESVVPEAFWWLSFAGGVCLFTYFVWRGDIVGVLGQSTGVVVYARNLRLIQKEKRRARRRAAEAAAREAERERAPEIGAGGSMEGARNAGVA